MRDQHLEVSRERSFRSAIWGQCFGVQPQLALGRGLGLLYLHALGVTPQAILVLLSLPLLIRGILLIPAAFQADRAGLKRIGNLGQVASLFGFLVLASLGWLPNPGLILGAATLGLVVFGAGTALFGAGWLALLSPLLPTSERARYLGRLRFARQLAAIAFGTLLAMWMTDTTPVADFQVVFVLLALCLAMRWIFYQQIPEQPPRDLAHADFATALRVVLAIPGYRCFCILVLASFLAIGATPMLFGLFELETLKMGDDLIWWLGVAMTVGHLLGARIGGRWVDGRGTRASLALSYILLAGSMVLLATRNVETVIAGAIAASLLFGLAKTLLELTVSSELLRLAPRDHKALAVSVGTTVIYLGESLAGLWIAWALAPGALGSLLPASGITSPYALLLHGLAVALVALAALTPFVAPKRSETTG